MVTTTGKQPSTNRDNKKTADVKTQQPTSLTILQTIVTAVGGGLILLAREVCPRVIDKSLFVGTIVLACMVILAIGTVITALVLVPKWFRMGHFIIVEGEMYYLQGKREILKLPFTQKRKDQVADNIEKLRSAVYDYLIRFCPLLKDSDVRSNLYVAQVGDINTSPITLINPERWRKNMHHDGEWGLRFRPNHGCTGTAYTTGEPVFAVKDAMGKWDNTYSITDEELAKLHPHLKWVVSVPIKDEETNLTLAVVNIDCLNCAIVREQLTEMTVKLVDYYRDLTKIVCNHKKRTIVAMARKERT